VRARRSCSAASDLLHSQQNERYRLRVAERRQREIENQHQTRSPSFQHNPADDYKLSPHVLMDTMTERSSKKAFDMMQSDTNRIVIHAEKTPAGEHMRRFSAPSIDEAATVIVADQFQLRNIVFHGETIN
ncbi:unnamed protein product, partial [Onchocerca ochengi]